MRRLRVHALAAAMFLAVLPPGSGSAPPPKTPAWRQAAPGHPWEFPRDLATHPAYRTEWWYVTGNLSTTGSAAGHDDPVELGFQLTFFRVGLAPDPPPIPNSAWAARDLIMAHASVTDPAASQGQRHVFSEVLWRAIPLLGGFGSPQDSVLAWCRAPAGTDGQWGLIWNGAGFRLQARDDRQGLRYDLVCTPTRPPVLHGRGGFSPKSADGTAGSLYFSQTRMSVTGTVYRQGRPAAVTGTSWLDREIFTSTLDPEQVGWDWLSLQLADGRDVMLYRLRRRDGGVDFALGTLVQRDGSVRSLPAEDWRLTPLATWLSDATGSAYPVRWRLEIPGEGLDLEIAALLPNQENVSRHTGVRYWEGAIRAWAPGGVKREGEPLGRGYLEMTGYGEDSRPPAL